MIFKTLNGDLTIFNKTLISIRDHLKALQTANATVYNNNGAFNLQGLLVNSSQSVSKFTKLNNAFKAYNGNLSKSTQLQNAYVQAVGKQNVTLGNYLAGLNGAKASMGGYVKSLIVAKAASIGLQAASIALNTAISMGITFAISGLISQISKWIHAQEEARQKALELTNSYKEQRDSLDSQIAKYKELKETLDNGNLSTDEARSIKEQLLEIQKSLIDSYGNEASNIDLVNGKYKEQLELLSELSKEKATDYVAENRDVFEDAKEELEKVRTYTINGIVNWNTLSPKTEDQQALLDFIESYSDLFDITADGSSNYASGQFDVRNLVIKADVESADEIMRQFYDDLDQFGKDNNIDVSGILEGVSGQLKKTTADEFKEYETIYDEFMKAEIVRNDTLRPLYQKSIQVVEDYNEALSSGEGVAEAKANLDTVQQLVQNATGELEGSQKVFDDIYNGINKNAESAYNLAQSFENDKSVKGYAEQLRGLTDIDLQAINFEDNVQSPGEEAFKALIDILGVSEEEVQSLIDKLVELGYVQGKVQNPVSAETAASTLSITDTVEHLNTQLKPAFDSLQSAWKDIFTDEGFKLSSIDIISSCDSIKSKLDDMSESRLSINYSSYEDFVKVLSSSESTADDVRNAFNALATSIAQAALSGVEDFDTMRAALEDLGVINNELVAFDVLISNTEVLKEAGLDLTHATDEQIATFANETVAAENVTQAIAMLTFHKELCDLQEMNTAGEVANLKTLAENAGYTGEVIQYLTELERIYQEVAGGTINPMQIGVKVARAAMLKALIDNAAKNINYEPNVDFSQAAGAAKKSKSEKDTTKEFDWIEQAIENVEKEVKALDDIVNSAYSTFSQKNEALAKEIGKVSEEIDLQQQAYAEYMRKADSIGLSDDYKVLVQNGAINIEDISDENLQKQIDAYQKWYDKAQNAADAVKQLKTDMKDLYVNAYELQTDNLKERLDSDSITQKQYLEGLKAAYEQFYAGLEDYAQQYHEAVLGYLDEEKGYLNDVAGAAASLLDREIDSVRDDADEQENRLKKQIDLLEDRKKPLEDELDALEDKAKREEQIFNLQKAQYALAKAEYQRTKLVNYMPDTIVI